jgi:uncharacterized membrane protein
MNGTAWFATVALVAHVWAAVVWVGGMFFAYVMLRPSVSPLDAPVRQQLWARVFGRFFAWVFVAIVLLLLSGYAMVFAVFGGFRGIGLHVHLMQATGILMMLLFLHLYFAPWRRFRAAVGRAEWQEGGRQLERIRHIVLVNLVLGLLTVAIGASGRYWG